MVALGPRIGGYCETIRAAPVLFWSRHPECEPDASSARGRAREANVGRAADGLRGLVSQVAGELAPDALGGFGFEDHVGAIVAGGDDFGAFV